ncbi:MAG: hypothetical protein HQK60_00185 [Deltaproteobacteria bacterium]|nr:hypothetical protein [Deltaproteobacteria bacterium]
MNKTIWLSFDIAIRGDLEGLYAWLDSHGAKECGTSLAVLKYPDTGNLIEDLKKDLEEHVTLEKNDRVYVTYQNPDGKVIGKFIFGKRKGDPWKGYGPQGTDEDDSD